MSKTFERPVRIRFSHCDPAGIVYFPQYLVMTNVLVEDWFYEGLRIDYARMIGERRTGLPIVKLDCDFSRPSRLGETIVLTLSVTRIGRSSIGIEIHGHCAGETRFRAKQVLVFMSFETGESIDIPGDIASALAAFAPSSPSIEAHRS
ncbi:4-hydroxybenzoyl-CoA thioesterase [Burkholderia sp. SRS-W-2-2016]|uniref:acyl-CoA thioesterase n=1 Tax=Burkholderia sp. SRS-W-2-2016 TaxID=1926878 RepID=UPI00094B6C0E|nr:thioesterase family protein [Burkholderia sp. SRS-W-2-2016]OLL31804.1 4-hydroxybenzoyl-CoA thioesterase [Burkholderia sp. SRS-W-2-2016]